MPTPDPVSQAEMIAAVRRRMKVQRPLSPSRDFAQEERDERDDAAMQAVLATLERHERAIAALKPFAKIAADYDRADDRREQEHRDEGRPPGPRRSDGFRVSIALGECRATRDVLAAFDVAGEGQSASLRRCNPDWPCPHPVYCNRIGRCAVEKVDTAGEATNG